MPFFFFSRKKISGSTLVEKDSLMAKAKSGVKGKKRDDPQDLANTIRDIIAGEPLLLPTAPPSHPHLSKRHGRTTSLDPANPFPSLPGHSPKRRGKRAKKHRQVVKKLNDPSILSSVLDLLRLMPNPLRPQAAMTQMFDHDWKSLSLPELQATGNPALAILPDAAELAATEMSAQTYWWGYELYFPPVTLQKLEDRGDVATGVLYFAGALAKTVPSIYPFINVLATFVALQFTVIKAMDTGSGIILVATWVLPFVFIPKTADDEDFERRFPDGKRRPFEL